MVIALVETNETKQELDQDVAAHGWIAISWEEFLKISQAEDSVKAKFYYYQGSYYKEMGVGANHAFVNDLIGFLVNLYCVMARIPVKGYTNCRYRQVGVKEGQPDVAYYVGDRVANAPQSSSVVDLEANLPPDLVIEIADSSLGYDLGAKRMLYEEVRVSEYWVINAQTMEIIAFRILDSLGSERIMESSVLSGLKLSLIEGALQRSLEMDNSQVGAWFMGQLG